VSRQGRVYKEKNGTYSFVVDVAPLGAPRKQVRRRGFRPPEARAKAQRALNELIHQADHGEFVDPSTITFGQWADRWVESLDLAPSTVRSYSDTLRLHAAPLRYARLQSLTTPDIDKLYADVRAEGRLSMRSQRYLHVVLRNCLSAAVRKRLITVNPTDAADPTSERSAKAPEMKTWSPAEMGAFLEHEETRTDRLAALWRLACSTGLRRGELCGLRWSDLDGSRLSVRRQVTQVGKQPPKIADTKTGAGHRAVALDDVTLAELRAHRARQNAEKLACGPSYRDDGLIFPDPSGAPLAPLFVTWRFNRLVKLTGAPRIRFHDLRHSHCVNLLSAGVNVKVVSARLGHSKVGFTLDRYAHVTDGADEDAAAKAARLVDGAGTT
jgi:integrase